MLREKIPQSDSIETYHWSLGTGSLEEMGSVKTWDYISHLCSSELV